MRLVPRMRPFVRPAYFATTLIATTLSVTAASGQSVESFYKGKDLRLVLSAGQGGGYGTYAHAIKPFLENYLPGKPTIVIQHMQGAGGIVAANWLANVAPKDGTVFALIHRGAVSTAPLFGAQGVRFDPTKFGWIGSMNSEVSVCISWQTTPIKSFADMKAQPFIVGGLGPGSDTDMLPNMINNLFDTKMRLITGYNSGGAIQLAVERGEVQGRCGWSVSSIVSTKPDWIEQKKINMLVQIGVDKHESLPDVPLLSDLAADEETKQTIEVIVAPQLMGRPFLAPPGVPAERLAALRTAFETSMKDPKFLAEAKKLDLEIAHVPGQRIDDLVKRLYALPKPIVERAAQAISRTDKLQVSQKKSDALTVKTALQEVKRGGREIVFKSGNATHTATLSGSRSKVTFGGKAGERGGLEAGMNCAVTYAGDKSEAALIACD